MRYTVKWYFTLMRIALAAIVLVLSTGAMSRASDSEIDRALANPNFTWTAIAADGVRLYYQPGSFAERHRVMLLRSAQAAEAESLAFLGMERDTEELRVIYVDDRSQMEKLIGHTYSGYSDWNGHGVFLVCNRDWRSFDTHEIVHVLTMGRWGRPIERSAWMIEGVSVAADGRCQTVDVDRIASYLVAAGRWPGLAEFTADGAALGEIPAGVFGASLVRHLRERYGARIIEETWRLGLETALKARGADPSLVETKWLNSLRNVADPLTGKEWQKLEQNGCG